MDYSGDNRCCPCWLSWTTQEGKRIQPLGLFCLWQCLFLVYILLLLFAEKTANLTSSLCPAVHQPFECSKWSSAEFNEMREMSLVSILWINCPDRGSSSHWSCLGWMFAGPVNEKSPLLILLLYWFSDKVGVLCQESHFLDDLAQSVHQPTTLVSTFLALTLIVDFFLVFSFFLHFIVYLICLAQSVFTNLPYF